MADVPLPATCYVLGIPGDGYTDDRCTSFPAWDDDAMHAHAAAVSAAARDCRTCKRYRLLGGPWCDIHDQCVNADRYEPLPLVRLWRTT